MRNDFEDEDLQALRERFRERVASVLISDTPQSGVAAPPTVQLNVRISSTTKATLAQYAEREGVSLAVGIARAVAALVAADRRL